jgi:hypothetical protein
LAKKQEEIDDLKKKIEELQKTFELNKKIPTPVSLRSSLVVDVLYPKPRSDMKKPSEFIGQK